MQAIFMQNQISLSVRHLFCACAVLLFMFCLSSLAVAQQVRFFAMLPDVPIMNGLKELPEDTLFFDKPEGRIVESVASIQDSLSIEQIDAFYAKALPHLGWKKTGLRIYMRDGEVLRFMFENESAAHFMRVRVTPNR